MDNLHDSLNVSRLITVTFLLLSGVYIVTVSAAVQCNIGLKMFSYESGNLTSILTSNFCSKIVTKAICAPITSHKCIESCEWNTSCSLTSHYAAFRGRRSYVSGMVLTNNSFLVQCCASLSTIVQMNAQHEPICVWVETPETVESKANVRFDPPLATNEYVREMFVERRARGRVSVKAQICKFVIQRTNCDKKTMTEEEIHTYALLQLRLSRTKEILNELIIKPHTATVAPSETSPTKNSNKSAIATDSFRDQKPLAASKLLNELNSAADYKQVSARVNKTQENRSQNESLAETKPLYQYRTTMRSSLGDNNHSEDVESSPIFNTTIFDALQHTVIGENKKDSQQSMSVLTFTESGRYGEQERITEAIHGAVYRHMIHKDQPMEPGIPTAVGRRIVGSNNRKNDATISPRVHATTGVGGVQRRSAQDSANLAMAAPRRWTEHHLLQITHNDDPIAEWPRQAKAAQLAALHGNKSASKLVRHPRPIFASLNGSYEYFSTNKHRDDRRRNALASGRRLGLRQINSSKNAINETLGLQSRASHLHSGHPQTASVATLPQGEELPMKNELQIRKLKTVTMESLGSTPIGTQAMVPTIENNDDEDNEEFKRPTSFGGSFADLHDYYSATNNHLLNTVQQQQIQSSGLEARTNGSLLKAPNFKIIPMQSPQQSFLSFTANSSNVLQRPTSVAQALLIKQRQRQAILERRRVEQQQLELKQQQQEQLLKSNFAELEAIRAKTAAPALSNRQSNSVVGAALSHSSLNNLLDCCQKQAPGCKNLCSKDVSKDEIKHALVSQQCPPLSMTSVIQCFPRYYNISSVTQCCANAARPARQPTSVGVARLPEQCLGLCAPDFKLSFAHFACIDHISSIVECYRDLLK